jgi:hypothetical protein
MSDDQKLSDLRAELERLAAEAGLREWNIGLEILIEGQDQGRLDAMPSWAPPELWDPESKLRRVYVEIVALRKKMHAQQEP